MDFYKNDIPILDENTPECRDVLFSPGVSFGMTGRDYNESPVEMFADPSGLAVYDPSEWDARYDEQEANESSLEHIYLRGGRPAFTNLNQNPNGYCWAFSTGTAMMMAALRDNRLDFRLNPTATAAIIKNGRDEGGWCGLSAKWARENGYAEEGDGPGQWPGNTRNLRYDTPQLREAMKKHQVLEDWYDLTRPVHGQVLTSRQVATACFNNIPVPSDFMQWRHSVCTIRWVRIERNSWHPLILNSWPQWGRFGLAVIRTMTITNAVAVRIST